jgi:hypothetical protein
MTVSGLDVWVLVTSRDVPDQVYSVLEAAGRRLGVDVQMVADQDGTPSTLEALCAHAPEIVLAHLETAGVITTGLSTELRRIAEHPAFASRRDALRTAFSKSAGYESLRERARQLLLRRFASEVESRAAFGQSIDIEFQAQRGRLVRRSAAVNAFTQWLSTWHQKPRTLAVLGEEGDGKTWAVASWSCRCTQATDARLQQLLLKNQARISFKPDDIDTTVNDVSLPGFVELNDVPDKVWKVKKSPQTPYGRKGPENPNHYADIGRSSRPRRSPASRMAAVRSR